MHTLTRRRALDAAAKVTLSLSAFACGGRTDNANPAHGPPAAGSAQASATDRSVPFPDLDGASMDRATADVATEHDLADSNVGSPAACNAPAPPAGPDAAVPLAASFPTDTAACCLDYATQRLPDGGYFFSATDKMDPNLRACCAVVIDTHPNAGELYKLPVAAPCCDSFPEFLRIDTYFLACTPWGPPVPPAMPRLVDDALELVG